MPNATNDSRGRRAWTRRRFLAALAGSALVIPEKRSTAAPTNAASGRRPAPLAKEPFFRTRGVIVSPSDFATGPWPANATAAGLTTLATHVPPARAEEFVRSDAGRRFLEDCARVGLEVEYEQHALGDLLPRDLFCKDPGLFRMNDRGERVPDANLCVSSKTAVAAVCENAVRYAQVLRPTTGRYFYWVDDAQPMCGCPECRGLSDSDQALLLENKILAALRKTDSRALLAHLCYQNTLKPPMQIKPERGVFLEFAPISRQYNVPVSRREVPAHAELLDALDANLAVFGCEGAQVLEYWLDVSRFSGWKRETLCKIPWNRDVFRDDLETYARRGIRHVTTFAVWLDGEYVARFGEPPLAEYGAELACRTFPNT